MTADDLNILERIQKNDEKAFETLFRTYYKSLCFFVFKLTKDTSAAEEIVQDLFFHIWDNRASLQLTTSIKSYLYKAAHNNSLRYLRHQKVVAGYETNVKASPQHAVEMPENYAETGEIMHIISETINHVPERTREIFELNRNEGLKYQEIAERMNISVKTVEAHISGLLKLLRQNLKDYLVLVWILKIFIG
ncbi:MAG: RNA polymerase sigma-70 factor [Bacteroidota bacterium]|nr:RNA polymerase sigma-70 factor [Bacteroidota bacterium]